MTPTPTTTPVRETPLQALEREVQEARQREQEAEAAYLVSDEMPEPYNPLEDKSCPLWRAYYDLRVKRSEAEKRESEYRARYKDDGPAENPGRYQEGSL